jgi:hypothetical protein
MKTYQIDIDDKLLPQFKRILNLLPSDGVRLYNKNGKEIQLHTDEIEISEELRKAIDEGIAELDNGEGIIHENVVNELQAKYPHLNFRLTNLPTKTQC